ncbi:MAG: thermonuclease family protein [Pseudomonadota bacterium]
MFDDRAHFKPELLRLILIQPSEHWRAKMWLLQILFGRRTRRYIAPQSKTVERRLHQPTQSPKPFNSKTSQPAERGVTIIGSAYVIDGDSLVIQKTQIRLFGVDAPELNHPFGQKAKWTLVGLCKGQTITAKVTDVDGHGRTVARCYLEDGRDISAEMVKAGLAIDWPKFSDGHYKHMEVPGARKKMWLANARQKGRMYLWERYENKQRASKETG